MWSMKLCRLSVLESLLHQQTLNLSRMVLFWQDVFHSFMCEAMLDERQS